MMWCDLWVLAFGGRSERTVRAMAQRGNVVRLALSSFGPVSWPIDPGQRLPDVPPTSAVLVFDPIRCPTELSRMVAALRALGNADTVRLLLPIGRRDRFAEADGAAAELAAVTEGAGASLRPLLGNGRFIDESAGTATLEGLADLVSARSCRALYPDARSVTATRLRFDTSELLLEGLRSMAREGALDAARHVVVHHGGRAFDDAMKVRVRDSLAPLRAPPAITIGSTRGRPTVTLARVERAEPPR